MSTGTLDYEQKQDRSVLWQKVNSPDLAFRGKESMGLDSFVTRIVYGEKGTAQDAPFKKKIFGNGSTYAYLHHPQGDHLLRYRDLQHAQGSHQCATWERSGRWSRSTGREEKNCPSRKIRLIECLMPRGSGCQSRPRRYVRRRLLEEDAREDLQDKCLDT